MPYRGVEQLFNYYPRYEYLDYIITKSNKSTLNIFIDLKGCLQSLYQEWAVKLIVQQTIENKQVDCGIFYSVLSAIKFHKSYAKKRGLKIKIIFFMESGKSVYHKNIYDKYKSNRESSDLFGLDLASQELFFNVLNKNYELLDKVVNRIPDCYFIRLNYLEADFVPWYILNKSHKEMSEECCNVVYSLDKDLLQTITSDNIFQYYRHASNRKMLGKEDAMKHYLKIKESKECDSSPYLSYLPLFLSIVGDSSDGYAGVYGIAEKTLFKIFPKLIPFMGSMDTVYKNLQESKPLFGGCQGTNNKAIQKILDNEDIIIRNLKLASFQLLVESHENDYRVENIKKLQQIDNKMNNTDKITDWRILYNSLNSLSMNSIEIEPDFVNQLF